MGLSVILQIPSKDDKTVVYGHSERSEESFFSCCSNSPARFDRLCPQNDLTMWYFRNNDIMWHCLSMTTKVGFTVFMREIGSK